MRAAGPRPAPRDERGGRGPVARSPAAPLPRPPGTRSPLQCSRSCPPIGESSRLPLRAWARMGFPGGRTNVVLTDRVSGNAGVRAVAVCAGALLFAVLFAQTTVYHR